VSYYFTGLVLVVSNINSLIMGSKYLLASDTPALWKTWLDVGATDGEQVYGEQATVCGRFLQKLTSAFF